MTDMHREQSSLPTLAAQLIARPRLDLFSTSAWTESIPNAPGVYVLWRRADERPIYVGETADLHSRMIDLGRYRNHTCRRKLAADLGIEPGDESALSAAISRTHQLSVMELWFGRAELEEYLLVRWRKSLINGVAKRHRNRYRWVTPDW